MSPTDRVDQPFPPLPEPGTLGHEDTTQVGPRAAQQRHCPGASPDVKGHDRLMSIVPTSGAAAPPPCPTCGAPATSEALRLDRGVATGDYLCPDGHIWRTTWNQPDYNPREAV